MTGRILQNSNVIEVRQGDSFTIKIKINKNGGDMDLTGSEINMSVRRTDDNSEMFKLLATTIDIENGLFALVLTPSHTSIEAGDYKTDIQLETPDGSINTIYPADVNKTAVFRVTPQVTE